MPDAIDRPGGRPVADQLYAVVPPVPAKVLLYAVPVTPFANVVAVIAGPLMTVIARFFETLEPALSTSVTARSRCSRSGCP